MTKRNKPSGFKDLDTEHLKCRSLGHAWEPELSVLTTVDRRQAFEVTLGCVRCGTERRDYIYTTDGERAKRGYTYVPGYLVDDIKSWGGRWEFMRNARVELYGRYLDKKVK